MISPHVCKCLAVWIVLLFSCACGGISLEQIDPGTTSKVIYVLSADPGNIDPHMTNQVETGIFSRQLYDTLVVKNKTGAIEAGLAMSWVISVDGREYTFALRNDVIFHDGSALDAESVAQNLDRIMKISTNGAIAHQLLSPYYAGYSIIDPFTIKLNLVQPYAAFLDVLSRPFLGIASPASFNQYSNERYQFHQSGTGPFILQDYVPGKRILLRRNPLYSWGIRPVADVNEVQVTEVEFQFAPESSQRLNMVNRRQADIVSDLSPSDARTLSSNSNINLFPIQIAGQPLQFLVNTKRFPTDSLAFRQALLYSTNRDTLLDTIFQRFSSIAYAPLTANVPYFNRNLVASYGTDTARAQALLASAGYSDSDNNRYLDLGGVEAAVTILLQSGSVYGQIAQLLVERWNDLGIRSSVVLVPTATALQTVVQSNQYNLVAVSRQSSDPVILSEFFGNNAVYNWTGYIDETLTSLLNEGAIQSDETSRANIYGQIEQIIMDQALVLPLIDPVRIDAADTRINGLEYDILGIPLLVQLRISL